MRELICDGAITNLLVLTEDEDNDFYTEGFDFFTNCVWNYVHTNLILEGPLNFLIQT